MLLTTRWQIFLTSGLILFLELALIRYLPARIAYLGYYSNFILLASFIGIGLGLLLARKNHSLEKFFPWVLLATTAAGSLFAVSVYPGLSGEIHFTSSFRGLIIPEFFLVPLIFLLVAATFVTISQRLGKLFTELKPLTAYTWDILGSLTGIFLFTLAAYLRLGPVVWFSLVAVTFLLLTHRHKKLGLVSAAVLLILIAIVTKASLGTSWSPYQNLKIVPQLEKDNYILYANNIGHQRLQPYQELPAVYQTPYELFPLESPYEKALVIGAGTGNDVALALAQGVKKITAVEIDPAIVALGQAWHPDKPYDNPRVTVYIDDARSFLEKNKETYDLIIFALPDSVLLASGRGNIRLESFLFTQESFAAAKEHLTPGGLMVLYNYYRQPWLVEKLAGMLQKTFSQTPYVTDGGPPHHLATLMVGDKITQLATEAPQPITLKQTPPPATDNWPFLYLKKPSLPWLYLIMLAFVGLVTYFSVSAASRQPLWRRLEPTYFFLGMAFLLLETTALVRFALLFGTTWLVNSLVFFAILALILLAITLANYLPHSSLPFWYAGLAIMLIAQYLAPLDALLILNPWLKYLSLSLLTLLPVFFANVIFSLTFKSSQANDFNFASNMLGAGVGGILEYTALITGYQHLIIVILICYAVAFGLAKQSLKPTAATALSEIM